MGQREKNADLVEKARQILKDYKPEGDAAKDAVFLMSVTVTETERSKVYTVRDAICGYSKALQKGFQILGTKTDVIGTILKVAVLDTIKNKNPTLNALAKMVVDATDRVIKGN